MSSFLMLNAGNVALVLTLCIFPIVAYWLRLLHKKHTNLASVVTSANQKIEDVEATVLARVRAAVAGIIQAARLDAEKQHVAHRPLLHAWVSKLESEIKKVI